jgi:transcriptional regulator with XRE-family HTH domain
MFCDPRVKEFRVTIISQPPDKPGPAARLLGARLARARAARGLSQNELGVRVGKWGTTISEYERGCIIPNAATLLALSAQLGCGVALNAVYISALAERDARRR